MVCWFIVILNPKRIKHSKTCPWTKFLYVHTIKPRQNSIKGWYPLQRIGTDLFIFSAHYNGYITKWCNNVDPFLESSWRIRGCQPTCLSDKKFPYMILQQDKVFILEKCYNIACRNPAWRLPVTLIRSKPYHSIQHTN